MFKLELGGNFSWIIAEEGTWKEKTVQQNNNNPSTTKGKGTIWTLSIYRTKIR